MASPCAGRVSAAQCLWDTHLLSVLFAAALATDRVWGVESSPPKSYVEALTLVPGKAASRALIPSPWGWGVIGK